MKVYLIPVNGEYRLHVSESKKTLKSKLEEAIEKMREGRIKSTLRKYIDRMENHEELALKTAYNFKDLEIIYSGISEKEARKTCGDMSMGYTKKNMWPMILYGALCPVTFVVAPFIPVLNWGVAFYFGYKFSAKYRGMKGYKKILNSKFVQQENLDLEAFLKDTPKSL